jgi:glycosyltransferase involved in cell wall biosynthesis
VQLQCARHGPPRDSGSTLAPRLAPAENGPGAMKILLVTQKLPLPLEDGYNLRIHHFLPRLAGAHEMHLFSLEQGSLGPELRSRLASVELVPVREPPRATSAVARLAGALSPDHLHDRDPAVSAALRSRLSRERFDLVWVSGWKMLAYAREVSGSPILGDVIDEGAREAWMELVRSRSPRTLARNLRSWWRNRAFERRYFPLASLCLFVSESDARATERLCPGLATAVVHNGVDADFYAPQAIEEVGPSLVFEGGMRHPPNIEGILHFHRAILPRIREALPLVQLWIVGKDPVPEVQALAGPSVHVTGFVPDVRPYVARANLFVSPLVGGAGIKNKILQAWAMGKAVVSTSLSCGGLAARDGENVILADRDEDFAAACVRLLQDPAERARLGAAGRRTVLERYTWDAKARELEAIFTKLVVPSGSSGRTGVRPT